MNSQTKSKDWKRKTSKTPIPEKIPTSPKPNAIHVKPLPQIPLCKGFKQLAKATEKAFLEGDFTEMDKLPPYFPEPDEE